MGRKRGIQYRPGSFYRQDDMSGLTTRAENTAPEWNGLIVDKRFWEARQPQDLVTGVADNQNVPDARPLPPPPFVGPVFTTTTANAAVGATVLPLEATTGFNPGSFVGIMLDSGVVFNTQVSNVAAPAGSIRLTQGLPYTAASGNNVTNYRSTGGP
jgi:hypothetical protein